jgi:hypothetical protein
MTKTVIFFACFCPFGKVSNKLGRVLNESGRLCLLGLGEYSVWKIERKAFKLLMITLVYCSSIFFTYDENTQISYSTKSQCILHVTRWLRLQNPDQVDQTQHVLCFKRKLVLLCDWRTKIERLTELILMAKSGLSVIMQTKFKIISPPPPTHQN